MAKASTEPNPSVESLLSKQQIAKALACSTRTLDAMISAGRFPRGDMILGRCPRWRVPTVNGWIKQQAEARRNN